MYFRHYFFNFKTIAHLVFHLIPGLGLVSFNWDIFMVCSNCLPADELHLDYLGNLTRFIGISETYCSPGRSSTDIQYGDSFAELIKHV